MAETIQYCINNMHSSNDTTLDAASKECAPKQHEINNEKIEVATKEKEKGAKCVLVWKDDESTKHENNSNDRCDSLATDI